MAYEEDNYQVAIEKLEEAVKYEEGQADMYFYKAKALMKLNRKEAAIEAIMKADSLYSEGRFLRGYYYEAPRQLYKKMIDELNDALTDSIMVSDTIS